METTVNKANQNTELVIFLIAHPLGLVLGVGLGLGLRSPGLGLGLGVGLGLGLDLGPGLRRAGGPI